MTKRQRQRQRQANIHPIIADRRLGRRRGLRMAPFRQTTLFSPRKKSSPGAKPAEYPDIFVLSISKVCRRLRVALKYETLPTANLNGQLHFCKTLQNTEFLLGALGFRELSLYHPLLADFQNGHADMSLFEGLLLHGCAKERALGCVNSPSPGQRESGSGIHATYI